MGEELEMFYDRCPPELKASNVRLRYPAVLAFGREIMEREPKTAVMFYFRAMYPQLTDTIDEVGHWHTSADFCIHPWELDDEGVERTGRQDISNWLKKEIPDEVKRQEWVELIWTHRGDQARLLLSIGQFSDVRTEFYDPVDESTKPVDKNLWERAVELCGLSRASGTDCTLGMEPTRKIHGFNISEYEEVSEGDPLDALSRRTSEENCVVM